MAFLETVNNEKRPRKKISAKGKPSKKIAELKRQKMVAPPGLAQPPPPPPAPMPQVPAQPPAATPASGGLQDHLKAFMMQDMLRRTGQVGDPTQAAVEDRRREGALMAGLLGPVAPLATIPVAAAGAGYEGIKGLGQMTGLGKYFPGPFKTGPETSPASLENVIGLMRGYTQR